VVTYLVRQPQVHYVTRAAVVESFALRADNHDRRRLDVETASVVGVDAAQAHGLLGNGIVVGISDSGLYMDHDQFDQPSPREFDAINLDARKVVLYQALADKVDQSNTVTCGHGTHVSGILAGSSYSQDHSDVGIAPHAKIAFVDIGTQNASCANDPTVKCPVKLLTPPNAADLMGMQVDAGAKIFSYSWGLQKDDYSRQAQNLDQYLFDHPDLLVVIAAGNSGDDGARTISSPAGAKNVITVGASMSTADSLFKKFACPSVFNPKSVAAYSSQGPTSDGRMKPDVVAPGEILWSAKSKASTSVDKTAELCPLQGTSQATPVVAGMAVLLYEWLRDGWWKAGVQDVDAGMLYIPAALIKALVIHSAGGLDRRLASNLVNLPCAQRRSQPLQYPDMNQGYGLPNMTSVASFGVEGSQVDFWPNPNRPIPPAVGHKGKTSYSFTLQPHDTFRATLVWTDPPGNLLATRMLQNDLDLSITVADAPHVVVHPLTHNGLRPDSLNNVEMVQVTHAALLRRLRHRAGSSDPITIQVHVTGASVLLHGPQPYSLVASHLQPMHPANERPVQPITWLATAFASTDYAWSWIVVLGCVVVGCLVAAAKVRKQRRSRRPRVIIKLRGETEATGLIYGSG
ncbi:hypothetical protein As57867_009508, partial [Aphanomyces stellatus]